MYKINKIVVLNIMFINKLVTKSLWLINQLRSEINIMKYQSTDKIK